MSIKLITITYNQLFKAYIKKNEVSFLKLAYSIKQNINNTATCLTVVSESS